MQNLDTYFFMNKFLHLVADIRPKWIIGIAFYLKTLFRVGSGAFTLGSEIYLGGGGGARKAVLRKIQ